MTLIVLTKNSNFYANQRIAHERKGQLTFLDPFAEMSPELWQKKCADVIWPRTTGVLFDDIDLEWCKQQAALGARIINPLPSLKLCRDKANLFQALKRSFPLLPFITPRGLWDENLVKQAFKYLGPLPYLVKTIRGNKGIGHFPFYKKEKLTEFWNQKYADKDQRYVIQPLLSNFREFRFLICRKKIIASIEKLPNETKAHQRNKGQAEWINYGPSKEIRELALNVNEHLNLELSAVEIIKTNNQLFVLEVNAAPGWEEMQRVLNIPLTHHIVSGLNLSL